MTTEGEYCPEHGLMECGGMYEMGTVAGSMAPVMGEGAGSKWYVTHELRTGDADRVAGPFADQQQAQAWMNDNLPMHLDDEGQYGTSEVFEGNDDTEIRPGMRVSQGTVVKVNGNTVTVKASNGDMMTMNIHDVDQGVAEGNDDPMNSNSAITGAYYESKDGDALLARIKSLALIK